MTKKEPHLAFLRPQDIMPLSKAVCVLVHLGIFAAFWELMQTNVKIYARTSILLLVIYTLALIWFHSTYGSMRVGQKKVIALCTSHLLSLIFSDMLLVMLCTLSVRQLPTIPIFILVFILQLIVSIVWCLLANKLYFRITPDKKAAIIHCREQDLQSILEICHPTNHFDVVCTVDVNASPAAFDEVLSQIAKAEVVFLGNVPSDLQERIIRYCVDHQLPLIMRPTFHNMMLSSAQCRFISHTPALEIALHTPSVFHRFCKRTMDIVGSALLLLITSPILALVALLVRLQDGGPALYRQKRLTKGGKVFEILKFRSMRMDAEKDGVARLAAQNDARITRLGKFIRATRLDELPQLWNILRGDMSLVGPRPERPEIAEQYSREIPEFNTRLQVKAGLTGYAQVHGKYNSTPQDKLHMDLMYISSQTIALDIKLILQTIQTMLKRESTEGVAAGQSTALADSKDKEKSA